MCMKRKKTVRIVLGTMIVLGGIELSLRFIFGFCDALLYESSDKYEYIAQPNQDRYRFFSHIYINSYGMRSEEPDSTKKRILGLGDSILFGPAQNDQDSLATTLFTNETGVQMLNISCGSWGPDNNVAYLREKGTFGAKAMVLVCSSHDAYDGMTFAPVVGVWPNYPDKQYKLAIWELIDRYVIPFVKIKMQTNTYADLNEKEKKIVHEDSQVIQKSPYFVKGFDNLKNIADSLQIPFYIYLHAEQGELKTGSYNDMGQQILLWADSARVMLISGMKEGETPDMYIDIIHLNEKGHRHLANVLEKKLKY